MTGTSSGQLVRASILHVVERSPKVVGLRVQAPPDYRWLPGQHLALGARADASAVSYYSIASAPEDEAPGVLELAAATESLPDGVKAERGGSVWLSQPGGKLTVNRLEARASVVLIGMGTGVTPLRAIAQAFDRRGELSRVTLVQGARTEGDLLFFKELSKYESSGFSYRPVLSSPSDGWEGRKGRVQAHLEALDRAASYRICGSLQMVEEVTRVLERSGVGSEQIDGEGY